jgi:tetratricopeptide (TPR) repeat protein
MPFTARICLALVILPAAWGLPTGAQSKDSAKPLAPLRPRTRQELDRREALKLYAIGLVCQREDRLLEALRHFEAAARLDPRAVPVYKALVPLYLALDRSDDALAACRKVLQLAPGDYRTWFVYGRRLRALGQAKEAQTALERGLNCKGLKDHPEIRHQMLFELGALHENAREYARAGKAFTAAVQILDKPKALLEAGPFDPDEIKARAAGLYERIGKVWVLARKYDLAVRAFQKARARGGDQAGRINFNLAEIYTAQGKFKKALRSVNAYLKYQPEGTEGYELKIKLLRQLGHKEKIIPALKNAQERDKYNVNLKLLLAREYAAVGKTSEAKGIYLDLAKGTPAPEVYRGLFYLYKKSGQMEEVLLLLDKTLKAVGDKENGGARSAAAGRGRVMLAVLRDDAGLVGPLLTVARPRLAGNQLGYETRQLLAALAARARRLADAEDFYRSCLARVDRGTFRNEAAVYGGLLDILWRRSKYAEVEKICLRGLDKTKDTNHLLFHLNLARALPYLDKMKEAIVHANKAVNLAGDDLRLYTRLRRVAVYSLAEKHDKAVAECRELLKAYSKPADVRDIRYTLSNVYTAAHELPKAEKELERVIQDNPDDATAHNDLGYLWADQGKHLKRAEEYIRKAIDLDRRQKKTGTAVGTDGDRDNAAYVDSLGWVLFRRGQLAAARRELEKAVGLPDGADDPVVWDHLGDVYFRQEQAARARDCWRKAVRLYEVEKRRRKDRRYKEIKQKIKQLKPKTQP